MRIVVPGLLAASSASDERLPALERILAYGIVEKAAASRDGLKWQSELLRALSLRDERRFPSAPVVLAGLREASVVGRYAHLDPARMETSVDGVSMRAISGWSSEQLEMLEPIFREHLTESGLGLEVAGTSMFIRDDLALSIETVSPHYADGRSLREVLPAGKDAALARRLMTELQMLIYDRLAEGSVNAVWLWGQGAVTPLPDHPLPTLYSNQGFAKGIYVIHEQLSRCLPVPDSFAEIADAKDDTVLMPADDSLRALEARWFEPLLDALNGGSVQSIDLYMDGARVRAERSLWKRMFAKPRAVREALL